MTSQIAWIIILITYLSFTAYFMSSEDKAKKRLGKGMLIAFGVLVVLPIAAGILLLLTCFGIVGLASLGH